MAKINAIFTLAMLHSVALKVRQYGKLYVTSEGQMFGNKEMCEEAVRTKNMILDEPDDYVSIKLMTKEDFTNERLFAYAKDIEEFHDLFDDAYIPTTRKKRNAPSRKPDTQVDATIEEKDEIAAILNGEVSPEPATETGKQGKGKAKGKNDATETGDATELSAAEKALEAAGKITKTE